MTKLNVPKPMFLRMVNGGLDKRHIKILTEYNMENNDLQTICSFLDYYPKIIKRKKNDVVEIETPLSAADVARVISHHSYGYLNFKFKFELSAELFYSIWLDVHPGLALSSTHSIFDMTREILDSNFKYDFQYIIKRIGLENFPEDSKNYIKILEK